MSKPLYLAGPMTGYPQFNYPLFDAAARILRDAGFNIQSPAEMDEDDVREAALASPDGQLHGGMINDHTWGDFLSRDVKMIADECSGVVLLPKWYTSKGARLEVFVAMQCNFPVFEFMEGDAYGLSYSYVLEMIRANTLAAYARAA